MREDELLVDKLDRYLDFHETSYKIALIISHSTMSQSGTVIVLLVVAIVARHADSTAAWEGRITHVKV